MKLALLCLVVLTLIINVHSAILCNKNSIKCNQHTTVFTDWMNNKTRSNESMFIKNTFGSNDPCRKYTTRKTYIQYLKDNNITCTGPLCTDNSFGYLTDIEHIIDLKNSILPNYDRNIYGNIILANMKWNREMGSKGWNIIQTEKSIVYGEIFNLAIENIIKCNQNETKNNKKHTSIWLIVIIVLLSVYGIQWICLTLSWSMVTFAWCFLKYMCVAAYNSVINNTGTNYTLMEE